MLCELQTRNECHLVLCTIFWIENENNLRKLLLLWFYYCDSQASPVYTDIRFNFDFLLSLKGLFRFLQFWWNNNRRKKTKTYMQNINLPLKSCLHNIYNIQPICYVDICLNIDFFLRLALRKWWHIFFHV